jgi:adenosylcobinamide-phosphate synthase
MMVEPIFVLVGALALDRVIGEPPNNCHPVAYLGRVIGALVARLKDDKLSGMALYLLSTLPFTITLYILASLPGLWGLALAGSALKLQFSWRGLEEHAKPVAIFLEEGEVERAREAVSSIVGRDTSSLMEKHIASAAVESVGDSTVDGIIAPLFYYAIFSLAFGVPEGVAAAAFYRATNTLDSMVGYRKQGLRNMGFFSARMDDLLNYLPARICSGLLIASAIFLGEAWRNSVGIYLRDRGKTPSPNAGHPISAVAGALGVRLEKVGVYRIGEDHENLGARHIFRALTLVNLSVAFFVIITMVAMLWKL